MPRAKKVLPVVRLVFLIMKRYERINEILKSLPKKDLKVCPSKGACACNGCVSVHGIRKHELDSFIKNGVVK